MRHRFTLCYLLTSMTAALASAGDPPLGVWHSTPPQKAAPAYRVVSAWSMAAGDALNPNVNGLIQWQCSPLMQNGNRGEPIDVTISLRPQTAVGPIGVTILQAQGQTNLQNGQSTATVAAAIRGAGQATMEVMLEVTDRNSAAGMYTSVVDVTVSAL